MKSLNLMYPEESDVKFKILKFPDGQQDIIIPIEGIIGAYWLNELLDKRNITIKSRFNSFKDLELIICATKALRRLGVKQIHLYIPYLLGARSDRQFVEGGNSYLVDVIAPVINSLEFESVTVVDVHSDVAAACIKNLISIDNKNLIASSLDHIYPNNTKRMYLHFNCILISPDAGALKKVYKVADSIGYKGDVVVCSKSRDENGNLSKTVVPISNRANIENKDIIIIDDICDGGATFINITKTIKEENTTIKLGKIYLIITHGIFSKGLKELSRYFDGIYTTDSIRSDFDWEQKEREPVDLVKIMKV